MLGLDARDGQLVLDPDIPEQIGRITLTNTHGFLKLWNLEAVGTQGHVCPSPEEFRFAPEP